MRGEGGDNLIVAAHLESTYHDFVIFLYFTQLILCTNTSMSNFVIKKVGVGSNNNEC